MDNMKLWNSVATTDPKYTKHVNLRGGFTDIDAHYNLRRATELWGPYGMKWGMRDMHVNELYGATGEGTRGLYMHCIFFYPDGQFDIMADMKYEPNGECVKKLQTMCIGKALSRLGFSADVYLGMFDDSAYVEEMTKKYATPSTDTTKTKVKTVTSKKTTTKEAIPVPDPVAAGLLGKAAQKYMDMIHELNMEGYVVNYKLLYQTVYETFGAYPTKPESVDTIIEKIPLDSVMEKNDFTDGL